jgi:hypothetical protein
VNLWVRIHKNKFAFHSNIPFILHVVEQSEQNNSELNIHENSDPHKNCCLNEVPNVPLTGIKSCVLDANEVYLHLKCNYFK